MGDDSAHTGMIPIPYPWIPAYAGMTVWMYPYTLNDMKMFYFDKEDILHLVIADGPEANSVELSPNITAELDAAGELIGIEILNASAFVRGYILETAQAKLLNLTGPRLSS